MKRPRRIRTPLRQHLRRIRYQMLPVLVFCASVYLLTSYWGSIIGEVTAVGEVAATNADIKIRPQAAGALVYIPPDERPWQGRRIHRSNELYRSDKTAWELLDHVEKNDLLVKLDDRPAREALNALKSEIAALEAQLVETRARVLVDLADRRIAQIERQNNQTVEARRLAGDIETHRQNVLDRQTELEAGRVQLKRRAQTQVILEKLARDGAENAYVLADSQLRHDTLAKQIEQQELALAGATAHLQAAVKRQAQHVAGQAKPMPEPELELDTYLEPVRQAIAAKKSLKAEMELQIVKLEIRSPITGQIVTIGYGPMETVQAGDLIMEIVPERGDHIVSYIPEDRAIKPVPGAPVTVKVRSKPPKIIRAEVGTVGTSTERMPVHQWADRKVPQWGRPIKIPIDPRENLSPGQLVDVSFIR